MKSIHAETLNIAILQTNVFWENKEDNLMHLANCIDKLEEEHPYIDLIILSEMFTTGFSMNPENLAETMQGPTVKWMMEEAIAHDTAVCGSLIIEENGHYYNRFVMVEASGNVNTYNKRHLFSMAGEQTKYTKGDAKIQIALNGFKITPYICYDLRFPVWCRNTEESDILIFVANWPQTRINHWKALLCARAIENQCYVLGANRVGNDGNNILYNGESMAFAPSGESLGSKENTEGFIIVQVEKSRIDSVRAKTPFLSDADNFKVLNDI